MSTVSPAAATAGRAPTPEAQPRLRTVRRRPVERSAATHAADYCRARGEERHLTQAGRVLKLSA